MRNGSAALLVFANSFTLYSIVSALRIVRCCGMAREYSLELSTVLMSFFVLF
jgi:hypothetical protein